MSDWDNLQRNIQSNYNSLNEEYTGPVNRKASSIQFDELFNTESEMDILEREGEYDLTFNMVHGEPEPNASNYITNEVDNIHDDDAEFEAMKDELKVIYKKFIFCTLTVIIFCTITLIAALSKNFYNWNGILFNIFTITVSMYGLLIHLCLNDCAEG
eukprot:736603_1